MFSLSLTRPRTQLKHIKSPRFLACYLKVAGNVCCVAGRAGRGGGGAGRALGIPRLFVLTTGSVKVTPSTWPLPLLQPRRKELARRGKDHLPGEPPQPHPAPQRSGGPFHFLPASPLRTWKTNVRRANQLPKRRPPALWDPDGGPTPTGRSRTRPGRPAGRAPLARRPPPLRLQARCLGRLPPPGPPPAARRPAAASARPPSPLTALTGRPPPPPPPLPRRGLTRCPPPCPRRSPVSTPKPSGRAAGAGR